jgi:hypothetical protein
VREMEPRAAQLRQNDAPYWEMPDRQCFQRAHAHVGAGSAGHWLKMAGILSPLIIGELVKDADKRWRWIRIASVSTALLSEGLYAHRIQREREERAQRCR